MFFFTASATPLTRFTRLVVFSLLVMLSLSHSVNGQNHLHAHPDTAHASFAHRSFSFGVGIPYNFKFNGFGLNAKGFYNVGQHLRFGPELFFFQHGQSNVFDIDFIGYYLLETSNFGVFPIVGGNYTNEWEAEHHAEALGFTWGFGFHKHLGKYNVFAEFTQVESELGAPFVSVGFLFTIQG